MMYRLLGSGVVSDVDDSDIPGIVKHANMVAVDCAGAYGAVARAHVFRKEGVDVAKTAETVEQLLAMATWLRGVDELLAARGVTGQRAWTAADIKKWLDCVHLTKQWLAKLTQMAEQV